MDKINEVMGLVMSFALKQADAREASALDEDIETVSNLYDEAYLAHSAIESKLRELLERERSLTLYEANLAALSVAAQNDEAASLLWNGDKEVQVLTERARGARSVSSAILAINITKDQ